MKNKHFFVSDLHGVQSKYDKLFKIIAKELPQAVFIGGDIFPHYYTSPEKFYKEYLQKKFSDLKKNLDHNYPDIFIIMGNDDLRAEEMLLIEDTNKGLFNYINNNVINVKGLKVSGYAFIPPSPFQLKDWEKYDVSRYVDPGCIHPFEGFRSIKPDFNEKYDTILKDLQKLTENTDLSDVIMLFHCPPYQTNLDRAALDGKMIDYVPLDVHIGSIAIKRIIMEKQPKITLHGHVHESTRLTGQWMQQLGNTISFNSAHDGDELCIIKFNPDNPKAAQRILI